MGSVFIYFFISYMPACPFRHNLTPCRLHFSRNASQMMTNEHKRHQTHLIPCPTTEACCVPFTDIYECPLSAGFMCPPYISICWFRAKSLGITCSYFMKIPESILNIPAGLGLICSVKNAAVAIKTLWYVPLRGNMPTRAALDLKKMDTMKWYRDTLRKETDSERQRAGNPFCFITC